MLKLILLLALVILSCDGFFDQANAATASTQLPVSVTVLPSEPPYGRRERPADERMALPIPTPPSPSSQKIQPQSSGFGWTSDP